MVKNMFAKKKQPTHSNGQLPKPGEAIPLPESLQKKIAAHKAAFQQQAQALLAQSHRNIELLVDGYVSSLGLPEDTNLSFNHELVELRVATPPVSPAEKQPAQ